MNAPNQHANLPPTPEDPGFAAYAQLVKMLLPSSACLAIYAPDGDLAWSSDGYERPDFRELIDDFRKNEPNAEINVARPRKSTAGVTALLARLGHQQGDTLGYGLIELGRSQGLGGNAMATSLTRPLFTCLAAQLSSDLRSAGPAPAVTSQPMSDIRLSFLLGCGEIDMNGPTSIQQLLRRCIDEFDCLSAVFCIPDQDLTEIVDKAVSSRDESPARLDATRRHLLAWAQLNNRTMIVNRIDTEKSPYRILSCPVPGRNGKPNGILALFRSATSINFELDDVRLMEFIAQQIMALLYERQDALTGLLSRVAFERHLDEAIRGSNGAGRGVLLYLDIESLERINDDFGYSVGDEAIIRAAQMIRHALTPDEKGCRLSGDRFVVHLAERDLDGGTALGAEIARAAAELGYMAGGRRVPVALRYGVADLAQSGGRARHWIAAAESACRRAAKAQSQSL
jgi:diguanylate cyclase (GGDEF)-like protein